MDVILFLLYLSDISARLQMFGESMFTIVLIALIILSGVLVIVSIFKIFTDESEQSAIDKVDTFLNRLFKSKLLAFCIVLILVLKLFTPSDKILQVIAGLYAGSILLEQPVVNSLLEKSYKIIDFKLDEILKDSKNKFDPFLDKKFENEIEDTKKFVNHK